MIPELARIISGGQTGADLGALRAGRALGVPTGGWMPRRFNTELGPRPWMARMYGMVEHQNYEYGPRTIANLNQADAVLLFGNVCSTGSLKTMGSALARDLPIAQNLTPPEIHDWVARIYHARGQQPLVLMVGGNRESINRGIEAVTFHRLVRAWNEEIAAPLPTWDVRLVNHPRIVAVLQERS